MTPGLCAATMSVTSTFTFWCSLPVGHEGGARVRGRRVGRHALHARMAERPVMSGVAVEVYTVVIALLLVGTLVIVLLDYRWGKK